MTGVHPTRSGIYRNMFGAHGPRWRHESKLLEKAVVLSQHFRDHGYHAAGGGKIFHTLQWTPGDSQNDPDAWDEYRGDPLDPISKDWPRPTLIPDAKAGLTPGRPLGGSQLFGAAPLEHLDEDVGDHLVVDWAIELMNREIDKPKFIAVGLFRPHIPWEVPQKWFDLYPLEDVKLPRHLEDDLHDAHEHGRRSWHDWVVKNKQWPKLMQGYLASISYVDHQLGRLLDALDASPMKDQTIICLWTDHGFHIGEKENWEKFALWDQTTRVPTFIHAPGISKDGEKTRVPVTLTDLYPTLCELAGLPIPEQCDGTSLVPQLKNPGRQHDRLSLTSFQFWSEHAPSHGVSDERYRYIAYANGQEELYDLQTDPHEFYNRVDDPNFKKIKARLVARIPTKVAPMAKTPTASPWHRGKRTPKKIKTPPIANTGFCINLTAVPDKQQPDGVLVSHGGDHHGYAVFVREGRPHFAIRRNRKPIVLTSRYPAPVRPYQVTALLTRDILRLSIDGIPVAEMKNEGFIEAEPNEGRTIGSDPLTPVGNYTSPFTYHGHVKQFEIN